MRLIGSVKVNTLIKTFLDSALLKMNSTPPRLGQMVDLVRYPIHELDNPITKKLIADCRKELDRVGCALIPNFMLNESLQRMHTEAMRLMPETFWSQQRHNPYMTKDDTSLPEDHPQRFFQDRSSGFINSDLLEEHSDLNAIYANEAMTRFVGECVGVGPIYNWADPLGCNPYSIMGDDQYFPWHFDGNEFTISILVQEAEEGGVFEYAPDIRSPEEENFDKVHAVLKGRRDNVQALQLRAGDLQLFKGRYSLHRVTPVKGAVQRIIALPTYVMDPDTVNRPERAKQFYGRALPIHYEREAIRPDALTD